MKTASKGRHAGEEELNSPRSLWARYWPWLRRLLTLSFFVLVGWLLANHARSVAWSEVKNALFSYSAGTVALALVFALGAYLTYSSYDLFGRHYIKSSPSWTKTMAVAFVSFAFNLNLGALVGSIALRYRLYDQMGLGKAEIAHIVGMTITTNWLGYLLLAGITFASGAVSLPLDWAITGSMLRILGIAFVIVVCIYIFLCRFSPRRSWHLREHELTLPLARIALLQLLLACSHWLLIASVLHTFLPQVAFLTLLGVLLVSSIAGAVAHIPGGLGVLEAVFITLLSGQVERSQVFATLIAYRAVFYLCPLALALIIYLYLEVKDLKKPA